MAGITLAQAEAQLQRYLDAETKVLAGQKVEIDGQSLTRANLDGVQAGIKIWNARVQELTDKATGRGRARTVSPSW